MDFYKYQALGNDYIVIDPQKTEVDLDADMIRRLCDRHRGIGSDGILYGPVFDGEDIYLRIFNPDGSETQKSGNGIRIFSRYLFERDYIQTAHFQLQTLGGPVEVTVLNPQGSLIRVDMGTVTFFPDLIPLDSQREFIDAPLAVQGQTFQVTCLSIGNPHCVIVCDELSREFTCRWGPEIENHVIFPERTNVQFIKVLDRTHLQIDIWERGAGYTLASGSSSCAAAAAAQRLGLVDRELEVQMPGGRIDIHLRDDGHIFMTGAVEFVYQGRFS